MATREHRDVAEIRKDFPILDRRVHGKPLVYLDNAATSHRPTSVVEAMSRFFTHTNANVHRGIHQLSVEATAAYEGAHEKVAKFVHAKGGMREIVFTKNTTESVNLVAYAWGLEHLKPGVEVLSTEMEHHSNIVPWQQLCKMTGATLKFIPVDAKTGKLDLSSLDSLLSPKVKMVTLTHMSNMLGTVNPVKEVAKRAHEAGALCFVDAAQSVPHMPVDVQDLGCDFLAFSGHKMLGPTGIGVLYGREEVLTKMRPFLFGGEMIKRVTLAESRFNDLPWKFEAGTPVIAEGVGLAAAIDYLNALGMDWVARHERELARYAFKRLAEVPDVTIYGPGPDERGGVVAFNLGSVHPHDLSSLLDDEGVAIRAGDHCTQPLHIKLGIPASARASFYVYNTPSEIDALAAALEKAHAIFGG